MFNFDKLLEQELPSKKSNDFLEGENCNKPCIGEGDDIPNSIDDIDSELEDDLKNIDVSDIDAEDISEDELAAIDDVEDNDEEDLDEDEAVEADELMGLIATPMLLKDELHDDEVMESFLEEFDMAVSEGFLLESDSDMFFDTDTSFLATEKRVFAPKTIVKFNEKDRRKQLFEVGVLASGRAHNDPIYWKLQKVYKLERMYKAKLRQKYRGEALKRVKAYVKRLKASSSKILNSLGDKIIKK